MSYYQPRFPRGKLRQVVTKYMGDMRLLGHGPNCEVAFGDPGRSDAAGWLLSDRRVTIGGQRYLLLEDGDVWREVETLVPVGARGAEAGPTWLNGPDDDVVTLLYLSLASARRGGDGYLHPAEEIRLPHLVDDRRLSQVSHSGPERRRA